MADLDSNLDDVTAWVRKAVDSFDFTARGEDQSLGRDLAGAVAAGIGERSADSKGPDGSTWPDNAPDYKAWKRKRYSVDLPNVRTGQMLSHESLMGEVTVTPDHVAMKYGTGTAPTRSATGAALTEGDKAVTDVEKAFFCSKDRPFYALDETIAGACRDVAGDALEKALKEAH